MQVRASQAAYLPAREPMSVKPRVILVGAFIAVLIGGLYWAAQRMTVPLNVPIEKIQVQGAFINVTEAMLEPLSESISGTGYFDLDVAALQQQIEALPWVKHATVRRVWPDTVAIHFVEQQPMAIWAEGGIVNRQGELFAAQRASYPEGLPVFKGPGNSTIDMAESYQQFSELLLPLGLTINELELDQRQSWRIGLRNGISLKLGRENIAERLMRFTSVYPRLKSIDNRSIKSVDLRYTNGLAMTWTQDNK